MCNICEDNTFHSVLVKIKSQTIIHQVIFLIDVFEDQALAGIVLIYFSLNITHILSALSINNYIN